MVDVRILSHESVGAERLDAFKMHAGVSECTRDDVIQGYLEAAALKVGRYYDRALLGCSVRLTMTDVERGDRVKLYMGGSSVSSVKDGTGEAISYGQQGSTIIVDRGASLLLVEYSTEEDCAAWCELCAIVYNYALGLYQQVGSSELNRILKGC